MSNIRFTKQIVDLIQSHRAETTVYVFLSGKLTKEVCVIDEYHRHDTIATISSLIISTALARENQTLAKVHHFADIPENSIPAVGICYQPRPTLKADNVFRNSIIHLLNLWSVPIAGFIPARQKPIDPYILNYNTFPKSFRPKKVVSA